jgi:Ras-related protein Rab-8A
MKAKAAHSTEEFDYIQKIIIIGDSGVGKSNMLLRFTEGKFADNFMMTIGINYVFKVINVQGVRIKLQIWDTAGQDKYKNITKNYYRNAQGVMVVFSIDDRESFKSVSTYRYIQVTGSKISLSQLLLTSSSC